MARVVARARLLDLDHLGAEVGEQLRAHGPASTRLRSSTRMPASGVSRACADRHGLAVGEDRLRRIMARRAGHSAARDARPIRTDRGPGSGMR